MRKNLLLLTLMTLCASLVSCKSKNKDVKTNHVWSAYSTENLISDWDYFDGEEENKIYASRDKALNFSCLKNENEGAQLMISATEFITSYDFEVPDVTGENGTIGKDHFSVAAAYYVNIDFSNEKNAMSGYYPDALVPFENFKKRRMNFIEKGRTQALYINLKTDKTTPSGEFKGTGKLYINGEAIDIPFNVKVYDATLPDAVHQNSAFGIWYDQIVYGEGENSGPEMDRKYYDFAVSKRLSPRELPPSYYTSTSTFIDNYVSEIAFNEKIASVRLPITESDDFKDKVKNLLTDLINKNLELISETGDNSINLFKKVFFYIDDEPFPEAFPLVRKHDLAIYQSKTELLHLLDGHDDLKETFLSIPNVVTREYLPELVATEDTGGIQTWCPLINHFNSSSNRELYKQRQHPTDPSSQRQGGEHVWWYTCCDPQSPFPNYHLDSSAMLSRVCQYFVYDYGIEASLFWCVNYYSKYSRGNTYRRDVWEDPISWQLCAGDGQFMYPGYTFGINGPITTLRLENLLASNEEYEYLWMIEQKVNEYNLNNGTSYNANALMNKYYSRLFKNVIIDTDTENFEVVRREILDLIEKLYSNLNDGISVLLS